MQALFGARNAATINLVLELIILLGLYIGFYYARKKRFRPHHANIQTTMVLLNLVLILTIMVPAFYNFVILGGTTTGIVGTLMIVHAILGAIAEGVALYLITGERTQIIPKPYRVKNIKPVMRATLALWTIVVILGIGIYYYRYLAPRPADNSGTPSPVAALQANATEFQIHAGELKDAVTRSSTPAIRRHTEHIINVIVGRSSPDYGDVDNDGVVEDPGDGTGVLVNLRQVRDLAVASGNTNAVQLTDRLTAQLATALADAQTLMQVSSYGNTDTQINNLVALGDQIASSPQSGVPMLAQALGVDTTLPGAIPAQPAGGSVTVDMQDFAFKPGTLPIKKGTIVTFINKDQAKHTVTADDKSYNSKDIDAGQSFTFTYENVGTFQYYCEYHGDVGGVDMSGTITVTE